MIDLSICLVNYNARDLTLNCVKSIYDRTKNISFEIILVDNHSTDNSVAAINDSFPSANLIVNQSNCGFAVANNKAISMAKGKFIILLNNDTVLKNNALDKMVDFMDKNPKVGVLACKLFDADGKTIQRNCRVFPLPLDTMFGRASLLTKLFPNNPISRKNTSSDWNYDFVREIDWVSGAVLMTRKVVINRIGILDEKFFMFWEDADFCKRASDAGWKVMFTPEAEIIHFTGKGGGKRQLKLRLYTMLQMHRSAYYYFLKHYYYHSLHPMAIFTFIGMMILIISKSIWEVLFYYLKDK